MESAVKVPFARRFNLRILVFIGAMLLIIGYPVYVFLDAQLTGGIRHLGNGVSEIDLKMMGMLNIDQTDAVNADIPQAWRDLDGKKVVAYGEMVGALYPKLDIGPYDLCYSRKTSMKRPQLVQRFIQLRPAGLKVMQYNEGPVKVSGTFHVDVKKLSGHVGSIFQLDVDSIEPAS